MFEDTKAVAFALDGTVYRGSQLIDGVDEVIRHCRKLGKSIFFLTNNSSETRSQIFHKLRGMGIDCTFREVLTSGYAAALHAHRERLSNVYVCGSKNLVSECEKLSVHAVEAEEAENMLIGLDPEFDYEKLAVAANVALGAGKVIACNKERSYPGEDQQLMPGCGGMVASVEWCSGRMVDLMIGKPSTFMLKEVSEQLGLAPAEILVVGDTYDTDILMANKFGSPSVIVSSHVYGDTVSVENIRELLTLIGETAQEQ